MSAIKGQPAPKPSGTPSPVPGESGKLTADALLAEFDLPQQSATADSLLSDEPEPVAAPAPEEPFQVQEPSSTMGINTDIKQQLADLLTRS